MKYLKDEDIKNKRVLLRCDFNVPVKDGKISDDNKIIKSLDTIKYLLNNNNIVILLSHFGRVKTEEDKKKNSLIIVYEYLKQYLDLEFISNPLELEKINNSSKKCFLVENTRYTDVPEKRESANDLNLAKYWAKFADIFVIDAFGSLHRAHSSTAGISKYLPTFAGFLVEDELKNLAPLINNKEHPFIVIMGGAKVDDKTKIVEGMLNVCDKVIITGGILNTFLKVMGYNVGNSLVSEDAEVLNAVKEMISKYQDKIIYNDKFVIARNNEILKVKLKDIENNDVIYDNFVENYEVINNAKMIFWNGTCGKYEDDNFQNGTKELLENLSKNKNVYIGGGDTVASVTKFNYQNKFTYLSSGGGATLEYVAFGKLKALEFIENN